jgi:hypothetical protein
VIYVTTLLLIVAALALAYARRQDRAEAATIFVIALPIAAAVAFNAPSWYDEFRENRRLNEHAALTRVPPVLENARNLPLAERALVSIAPDETFAIVPSQGGFPRGSAAARNERARQTYANSWLQYWLAPRVRVDPNDAKWLVLVGAGRGAPPAGGLEVLRFGDDLLVRRR